MVVTAIGRYLIDVQGKEDVWRISFIDGRLVYGGVNQGVLFAVGLLYIILNFKKAGLLLLACIFWRLITFKRIRN